MSDGCGSSEYLQLCLLLSVMVFFFKQKTAYEMGISDWSSDVCSSDLSVVGSLGGTVGSLGGVVGSVGIVPGSAGGVVAVGSVGTGWPGVVMSSPAGGVSCASAGKLTAAAPIQRDRKSVVSGKSVSVRVDLGGRRIIKKKHKNYASTT